MKYIAFIAAAAAMIQPALAKDYYVDGAAGRQSNVGTSVSPFLYFWQAEQVAKPGDTIHVLPTTTYPKLSVQTSGAATAPITIVGAGGASNPTKVSGGGTGFGMWVNAQYVTIQNFDITAPGPWSAIDVAQYNHHVTIDSNILHDSGLDGVNAFADDYVTISNNTVYNNSKYTAGGIYGSGISILGSLDIDASTSIKTIITGNIVYNNTNIPNCPITGCTASNQDSDGNGIIIDNNQGTYWNNAPYHGSTLISNNVVVGNGGRGIHMYISNHVIVSGNTTYFNNQDIYEGNYMPGEIEANSSGDISVYNNLLYSDGGTGINNGTNTGHHVGISFQYCTDGIGQLIAQNNLVYNPANNSTYLSSARKNTLPTTISSNMWAAPSLTNASLDLAVADFRPTTSSVALGNANAATSVTTDILGVSRAAPPTIGAYENPAP